MTIALKKLVQTCSSCPTQWDAWDIDDNYYFIRYRWGRLTVSKGFDSLVVDMRYGGGMDGTMDDATMLGLCDMALNPPDAEMMQVSHNLTQGFYFLLDELHTARCLLRDILPHVRRWIENSDYEVEAEEWVRKLEATGMLSGGFEPPKR